MLRKAHNVPDTAEASVSGRAFSEHPLVLTKNRLLLGFPGTVYFVKMLVQRRNDSGIEFTGLGHAVQYG